MDVTLTWCDQEICAMIVVHMLIWHGGRTGSLQTHGNLVFVGSNAWEIWQTPFPQPGRLRLCVLWVIPKHWSPWMLKKQVPFIQIDHLPTVKGYRTNRKSVYTHSIHAWYIYLHLPSKSTIHVGKYTSPMGGIKAVNLTMPGGTAAQMASIPTAPMSFLSPVTPSQVHQDLPLLPPVRAR